MGFVRSIYPRWDSKYADDLLRRFDLKAQQKIKGMSHGQRVKAALLLALARRPRLLVLDEPTTGLDPIARREVLGELMAVLADEERTVLFSSHNTLEVEQISDQITFIDRGRILESSDKETFLDRWRRLRLVLPPNTKLPGLPGVVNVDGSGRLPVVTTNRFEPTMVAACTEVGVAVQAVDVMTLEEIFMASVQSQREGRSAMNIAMVSRLIWKDWYLNRAGILASLIGGVATLGLVAAMHGSQHSADIGDHRASHHPDRHGRHGDDFSRERTEATDSTRL